MKVVVNFAVALASLALDKLIPVVSVDYVFG